jgi:hypothetical protein
VPYLFISDRSAGLPWLHPRKYHCGSRDVKLFQVERYHCPTCVKSYGTRSAMNAHYKYDCGKPPRFQCPYCGKLNRKKFNVQDHIRRIHPERPIVCNTRF